MECARFVSGQKPRALTLLSIEIENGTRQAQAKHCYLTVFNLQCTLEEIIGRKLGSGDPNPKPKHGLSGGVHE